MIKDGYQNGKQLLDINDILILIWIMINLEFELFLYRDETVIHACWDISSLKWLNYDFDQILRK